jgi:RecA/RadA recombinase
VTATDSFDAEKQEELLDYFISWMKVDGVIVFSLRNELKKAYRTPLVSLFNSADARVDAVKTTMSDAIFSTAKLLHTYGQVPPR